MGAQGGSEPRNGSRERVRTAGTGPAGGGSGTSSLGGGNSIFLSMRPGRSRAESRMSILLVAMITCTGTAVTTPGTAGLPGPRAGLAPLP